MSLEQYADRIFATFMVIAEPMRVEGYGNIAVTVREGFNENEKTYLTSYELQKLQKEFKYVHILDGKVVCTDV